MRSNIRTVQRRTDRQVRGQAIIEGCTMLIVIVFLCVGLIAGCMDVYANLVGAEKLRQAALAAARVYSQQQTLYNAMLVESQEPQARVNATAVANTILDQLGIPKEREIKLERQMERGALVAKVTISANILVPFKSLTHLPGHVTITAFDAIGFGKVRLGRIVAPLFPEALANPNATNPFTYAAPGVKSIAMNFPIFEADTQTAIAPGILSRTVPVQGFEFGTFPGMSESDKSKERLIGAGISAFGQGFRNGGNAVSLPYALP